jgi:hypothetical protein
VVDSLSDLPLNVALLQESRAVKAMKATRAAC